MLDAMFIDNRGLQSASTGANDLRYWQCRVHPCDMRERLCLEKQALGVIVGRGDLDHEAVPAARMQSVVLFAFTAQQLPLARKAIDLQNMRFDQIDSDLR